MNDPKSTALYPDDPQRNYRERITKALAELDLAFSIGVNAAVGRGWTVTFEGEPSPLSVLLFFQGEFHLGVVHTASTTPVPDEKLHALLELNTRLIVGKVARDADGRIAVWTAIRNDRISAETIEEALRGVTGGAEEVRRILTSA